MAFEVRPVPTEEEVAAIVAAVEVLWPKPVVAVDAVGGVPPWRFSGRWWAKPSVSRRRRPW